MPGRGPSSPGFEENCPSQSGGLWAEQGEAPAGEPQAITVSRQWLGWIKASPWPGKDWRSRDCIPSSENNTLSAEHFPRCSSVFSHNIRGRLLRNCMPVCGANGAHEGAAVRVQRVPAAMSWAPLLLAVLPILGKL